MKKLLILSVLLLGSLRGNAQEFFGSATHKSADGYLTGGFIKRGWGAYVGFNYKDQSPIGIKSGTVSNAAKFGIIRVLPGERVMIGAGIQPQDDQRKLNLFVGYNFVKSTDLKIWAIGNVVGSTFAPGIGLTYRVEKITF